MYYIVFLLGIILSIINDKKRLSLYLFAIILAMIAFFRYGVGSDYFNYEFLYIRIKESIVDEWYNGADNQEFGFRIFGAFLKSLGFSYQQYLIVIASINLLYVVKTCKEYSKNPTLSLLIYFSFYYVVWTFSGLRQGVTMAVGVYYLLKSIEKNNALKFAFIVLLLSFIHESAVILLLLYFVSKVNFKKKSLIYVSIFSIIWSMFPVGFLISKLTWLPFMGRVNHYIDDSISLNLIDFQGFARIVFLIMIFIYYDAYSEQDTISKKIINVYIVSITIYFILNFSELIAARISIFGKYLDVILLTNIYYLYKQKINKLLYVYGLCILCVVYLSKDLFSLKVHSQIGKVEEKNSIIVPYTNIYNKDEYWFR